jgi:hypothetical protein
VRWDAVPASEFTTAAGASCTWPAGEQQLQPVLEARGRGFRFSMSNMSVPFLVEDDSSLEKQGAGVERL